MYVVPVQYIIYDKIEKKTSMTARIIKTSGRTINSVGDMLILFVMKSPLSATSVINLKCTIKN